MLLLIIGLGILGLVISVLIGKRSGDILNSGTLLCGSLLIIFSVVTFAIGTEYSSVLFIDDKITMYETENSKIETSINELVKDYQNYEKNIYEASTENLDPTLALSIYPELKSNELVKSQIELYIDNNTQIKELKTHKLDLRKVGWWLFFKTD